MLGGSSYICKRRPVHLLSRPTTTRHISSTGEELTFCPGREARDETEWTSDVGWHFLGPQMWWEERWHDRGRRKTFRCRRCSVRPPDLFPSPLHDGLACSFLQQLSGILISLNSLRRRTQYFWSVAVVSKRSSSTPPAAACSDRAVCHRNPTKQGAKLCPIGAELISGRHRPPGHIPVSRSAHIRTEE